jgi:hypothetical protein
MRLYLPASLLGHSRVPHTWVSMRLLLHMTRPELLPGYFHKPAATSQLPPAINHSLIALPLQRLWLMHTLGSQHIVHLCDDRQRRTLWSLVCNSRIEDGRRHINAVVQHHFILILRAVNCAESQKMHCFIAFSKKIRASSIPSYHGPT